MLNEAIIKLYCDNGILKNFFVDTNKPHTILNQLTKTGIKYTWETVKDERIDNIQYVIEVRVYMPGNILYGRHVYKTTDASNAHLYAITNAIKTIIENVETFEDNLEQSQQNIQVEQSLSLTEQTSSPLSQDEILNMVQQQNTKITTAEQLEKDPREEIPFDDIDMDLNELNNLLSGTAASKIYDNKPDTQQSKQPVSHGFTQDQINAINDFKQRLNITNDALFGSYINSWNSKLSKKEDLTPENIDLFIEWTHTVGKAPC